MGGLPSLKPEGGGCPVPLATTVDVPAVVTVSKVRMTSAEAEAEAETTTLVPGIVLFSTPGHPSSIHPSQSSLIPLHTSVTPGLMEAALSLQSALFETYPDD